MASSLSLSLSLFPFLLHIQYGMTNEWQLKLIEYISIIANEPLIIPDFLSFPAVGMTDDDVVQDLLDALQLDEESSAE